MDPKLPNTIYGANSVNGGSGAPPRPGPSPIAYPNSSDPPPVPEPLRPSPAVTRAQKYDDEKRRIASSCFNKLDEQGKPLQSYITHIRVEEDAVYQSSPAPPGHPPHHRKPRVIIVAVRNNSHVSMHKARENEDGSFQIGKTWPLEELKSVESFTHPAQSSPEDENRARWAGATGFIITMAKAYYWQAKTPKEKDFFIGSLVKIYNKYTEGKVPELIGFDPRFRDDLLASTKPPEAFRQAPRTDNLPPPLQPPVRPFAQNSRPTSPASNSEGRSPSVASSDFQRAPPSGPRPFSPLSPPPHPLQQPLQRPSPTPTPPPQPGDRSRYASPQALQRPSRDHMIRQTSAQDAEQIRSAYARSPPPPGSARLTPQGSRTNFTEGGASAPTPPILSPRRQMERSRSRQDPMSSEIAPSAQSLEPKPLVPATADRSDSTRRSSVSSSLRSRNIASPTPPSTDQDQTLPERRRPPLNESDLSAGLAGLATNSGPSVTPPQTLKADAYNPHSQTETNRPAASPQESNTRNLSDPSVTKASAPEAPNGNKGPLPPIQTEAEPKTVSTEDETPTSPGTTPDAGPQFRPGLGPMMGNRKAELANKMRKAVAAHTAFKPRAGGAGDRLLGAQAKPATDEPDGITGVFPAKPVVREAPQEDIKTPISEPEPAHKPSLPPPLDTTPSIQIDSPVSPEQSRRPSAPEISSPTATKTPETLAQARRQRTSRSPSRTAIKPRINPFESALSALGVDPTVLAGREIDYEDVLNEFGWKRGFLQTQKIDALETDLKREISRLEAGSWLSHSDQKDERIDMVEKLLDKTIAECEEMEGLLTLYSVELSTLNEDIAFIEAQSQGLQVQTANQKLLQMELQTLVDTISLKPDQMDALRTASLGDINGIGQIEQCLVTLYKALKTIDPSSIKHENASGSVPQNPSGMAGIRALQERKQSYMSETNGFLHRLKHNVDPIFGHAFHKTKDAFAGTNVSNRDIVQIHSIARSELWKYHPMILFAKEVNNDAWQEIMRTYQGRARELYRDELRDAIQEWKRRARKTMIEENEALFTTQEKESEGLGSTARKLTVKRSHTLARGLRTNSSDKKSGLVQNHEGNQHPFEIFYGVIEEALPIVTTEQNFFVDFFHETTLDGSDFPEAVADETPGHRRVRDLVEKRPLEPDRETSKRVIEAMESIFNSWHMEMQSLIDWAVKQDPFQGVGIIAALEREMDKNSVTSQEFLVKTLNKLHDSLATLFTKFIDDQIRAVEATKIKTKKRKGVMHFFKVFPNFSAIIENILATSGDRSSEGLEIRKNVDHAYERINKAMFSSLKQIAKEGPHHTGSISTAGPGSGLSMMSNADPEDKEALNHEILQIENMYYYYTEVDEKSNSPVLGQWRGKAMLDMSEHQELYVNAVIRRPLGKLLDFVEGLEALLQTPHADVKNIPTDHPTYSRSALKKLLSTLDTREGKRGIDALKKRIEKHFGEGSEDVAFNQRLMTQILGECERKYINTFDRLDKLIHDVYGGEVDVEFSKADISVAFKR